MNHNFYYTLLSKRAGGPGTPTQAVDCTDSLQLRYSYIQGGGGWVGAAGTQTQDWAGLVGGEFAQVWPSTPALGLGTRLYLDSGLAQEISLTLAGNWYRIDAQLFQYDFQGISDISPVIYSVVEAIPVRITQPSSTQCNLQGPYNQTVWVNRDAWQQVDRIWLDESMTQPFLGGGSWYHVTDNDIPSSGTTLRVNDCGWVIGYTAC